MALKKDIEMKKAAKEFAAYWKNKGYEKGESQKFWLELLGQVFGVENPSHFMQFEEQVKLDNTSFIDVMIPSTHVMIEQKSIDKDLRKGIKQSDGSFLTPFQQAVRYSAVLPYSQRPRWIVTCNFKEFLVYDMENPNGEPESILLENLPKEYYRLNFLVDTGNDFVKREEEISIKAGEIVGKLYDAISKQYVNLEDKHTQRSLNVLCVRLVFCFYAEDAGVFGKHLMFHDYLKDFDARHFRSAILDVFKVLNTKPEDRDPYMDPELAAFPYVNGGLFADDTIEIPQFTDEIRTLILQNASEDFDWSEISPTIFGAVFESTLNPETRRSGGMHYTSIENIHKVIDPLFLDDLRQELAEIKEIKQSKTQKEYAERFCQKLSTLKFLDPACGSGNFLTETYISLRILENQALKIIRGTQITFADNVDDLVKVSIDQFYGIEINDFAVTVAKTALWIAESQMLKKTEEIVNVNIDFLPLTTNAYIVEGNALQIDWNDVVPASELNYIMGNPPFLGFTYMDSIQKESMQKLFPKVKNLDYVCGWYKIAKEYIEGTQIECAFVSTNSITQGETVARLWKFLNGIIINFAYRTFIWSSEASDIAHVHCVIIGFSYNERNRKLLFNEKGSQQVSNINPYLCDAPNIIVESRNAPLCNVSKMVYGNKPADGGNLIIEECDYENFIKQNPSTSKYVKPFVGAVEFLHNKKRYCLWLENANPVDLKNSKETLARIEACKNARENSIAAGIRKFAMTPTLFAQRTQPIGAPCIVVPRVSSQRRRYVPMAFLPEGTVVSDAVQVIPEATIFEFGVITSNVHMAWMRAVCGRLKSDYRYSKDIVYNNFPWCNPTDEQKAKIELTAQAILDARAKYPDCSLADLYDELTMPPELRKAHQENDKAVMQAYGFDWRHMTESECVAELMKMYQKLTEEN
ncbi:MAG: class I SAM-dependent DNA methyltransferase [Clostridia bacterium]|nr:class I SAM-dependent DNA methyltransferase [Clostridia bacterium]